MDKKFIYAECKICGDTKVEPSHFWREHHIKEAHYAWTYEPRHSKLTGNLIKFKNRDFYFNSDFNDKNELKKWIKENPEAALPYCLDMIKQRKVQGKLTYTPSQVELRSLCSPNVIWYQNACNYNLECKNYGLLTRFKYKMPELKFDTKLLEFIVDTREQKPLKFPEPHRHEVQKLEYGDYWAINSKWSNVYVERKNLSDFIGTLSNGFERFEREIERAQADNNYLIILVEESINNALGFNMLPHISKNIKASPDYIFHKVRVLMQDYGNIQFVFVDGRAKAVDFLIKIYQLKTDPTQIDWQYAIDKKLI